MKKFKKNFTLNKKENGYAMLELLFYITLFSAMSLVVIEALLTMTRSFKETAIFSQFVQSGNVMERVGREIRQANDIASISASDLMLNTVDNAGAAKTVEFLLSGSNLELLENGTLSGNLNTPNMAVTALTFTQITTAKGKAVKVFLTVRSLNDTQNRTEDF
ncbi:MAG: hypothetical protein ACREGC_04125, partial [Minisyncoccia bacterium]